MSNGSPEIGTATAKPTWQEDVSSGLVVGIVTITYCLSFAAMIFSGSLGNAMPYGVTAAIIGAVVSVTVVSLRSTIRGATAGPDTPTMAVVATMAAAIGTRIVDVDPDNLHNHVMAAIVASTVITGMVLLLIGYFRLGQWMRFIPYPVVGGFLAASGWLLCMGAVKVLTGERPDLSDPGFLLNAEFYAYLLPGALFAVLLFVSRALTRHYLVVPVIILCALAGADFIFNHPLLEGLPAPESGWFMAPMQSFNYWIPLRPEVWLDLDWSLLLIHAGEIGAAAGVTAVAILLNATGLEVDQRTNMDIDRELRSNGIANIISGFFGGMIGNLSLNRSRLNIQAGARTSVSGMVTALTCIGFLLYGGDLTRYIPTPVIGGLLLFLGLSMLFDWLVRARERLSLGDYWLVITIWLCIVNLGYLEGAVLGVVASSVMFALRYSRIRAIKHHMTAREYASYVERSRSDRHLLNDNGDAIQIFQLQGYLFFGSSNSIFETVRDTVQRKPERGSATVILDFKQVSGIDSSAVFSFTKLWNHLHECGYRLVISAIRPDIQHTLDLESKVIDSQVFPSLEQALELAEENLLSELRGIGSESIELETWLSMELDDAESARDLVNHLKRLEFEPGEHVCRQGEPSDEIFLAVSGRVSIVLELPGQPPIRLRSMLDHTMVGEMGFFRGAIRAASVLAEQNAVVYSLDRETFEDMKQTAPGTCVAFQLFVIKTLSDRLQFTNNEISALQR